MAKKSSGGCLVWVIVIILVMGLMGSCSNNSSSSSGSSYDEPLTQTQQDNADVKKAGEELSNVIQYETSQGR